MNRPRTKTRRVGLALSVLSIVATITAVVPGLADSAPPTPIALPAHVPMAGADFPGAPPAFEIPAGGSVEVIDAGPDDRTFVLKRSDGTLFAEARVFRGHPRTALFYDEAGTLAQATHALWPDEAQQAVQSNSTRTLAVAKRKAASCTSNTLYNAHGWRIDPTVTFDWRFNAGSTPSGMSVDTTETYLRNGHAEWYNNTNWCGVADNSSFLMAYGGRTTLGWGDNGYNTVGFGDGRQIGCDGAVACTRSEPSNGINQESDTRLNSAQYSFINGAASGKYDTWSIMAHELGHTLGCDDQAYTTEDVMYYLGSTNDVSDQKLGRGDATCNNDKY